MARSRLVLVPNEDGPQPGRRWLAMPGEHTTYRLLHVIADLDDLCRVAPVAAALDRAGAFEHIAVDVTPTQGAPKALEELGIATTTRALDVSGRSIPRRLGALLEGFDRLLDSESPTAAIVYAEDDPSLACALSAAKQRVPVVRVLSGGHGAANAPINSALMNRLADMLLAADPEQADRLVREHVPPHRIHVVGDPLMDMVRRYARRSAAVELCRRNGVEPGSYVLVAMTGPIASILSAPLRALSARLPLLVRVDPSATTASERDALVAALHGSDAKVLEASGLAARLCLERAAGAIITDSARIAERAALLGVPCRLLEGGRGAADAEAWNIAGLRARRRPANPGVEPLRDGGAPGRLADAIIANFARVVAAAAS
jgi:UDP-N-acetylglucosamine 2-epimerase (non-hydrolysing)